MPLPKGSSFLLLCIAMASVLAVTAEAKTIAVGGSQGWRLGVNYTDWAIQNTPFYIDDKLVFKYDPPSERAAYSVYLLPNLGSFMACDFSEAQLLANATQGAGEGFAVTLSQWRPYYLASHGGDGSHCVDGSMRVMAVPWPRLG